MLLVDLEISHAMVICSTHRTDTVLITTTMPSPIPSITNQTLSLQFDAEQGTGVDYCREYFGITPEVVHRE